VINLAPAGIRTPGGISSISGRNEKCKTLVGKPEEKRPVERLGLDEGTMWK
jgi:hypothetical protein